MVNSNRQDTSRTTKHEMSRPVKPILVTFSAPSKPRPIRRAFHEILIDELVALKESFTEKGH